MTLKNSKHGGCGPCRLESESSNGWGASGRTAKSLRAWSKKSEPDSGFERSNPGRSRRDDIPGMARGCRHKTQELPPIWPRMDYARTSRNSQTRILMIPRGCLPSKMS